MGILLLSHCAPESCVLINTSTVAWLAPPDELVRSSASVVDARDVGCTLQSTIKLAPALSFCAMSLRSTSVVEQSFRAARSSVDAAAIRRTMSRRLDDGEPIRSLKYPYMRWRYVMEKLDLRYRDPYTARHSCVSWHLMLGKNLVWCARQHGHSVQVMLSNYGTWIESATDVDVEEIKRSLTSEPTGAKVTATAAVPSATPETPGFASNSPVEEGWGRLSWRKTKYFNSLTGGADGTRIRLRRRGDQ